MPSTTPKLSILVPSIPSRFDRLVTLYRKLEILVGDHPVEILCCIDNKKRSIGLKRDTLVQAARGDYIAFVDDDDEISDDYVESILKAIEEGSDVIVFKQHCTINDGNVFTVDFDVNNINEEATIVDDKWIDIKRKPFHICGWKREIAQKHRFPDASYGEDWYWCVRALADVHSQTKIDKHLHFYRYNDRVTEAALDFPKEENSEILPEQ